MSVAPTQVLLLGTDTAGTVAGVTTGMSRFVPCEGANLITIFLRSIGTTSGGNVQIEEADWLPSEQIYTGTWSPIGAAIAASSFTGGAMLATHLTNSAYAFLRVRVSADITGGGTIIATLRMQGR